MDIDAELFRLELQLGEFEDLNNPEDRMDMKQELTQKIKSIRTAALALDDEDDKVEALEKLSELEEVLSY